MASTDDSQLATTDAQVAASNLHNSNLSNGGTHRQEANSSTVSQPPPSKPVEMTDLSSPTTQDNRPTPSTSETPEVPEDSRQTQMPDTETSIRTSSKVDEVPPTSTEADDSLSALPTLGPTQTMPAIGAATDQPIPKLEPSEISTATLMITLLLHTGARHPYKIDEKYLKKRNVTVTDNNPLNMSVYTLKELIWRDWRDEWDPRPASPSSIRLIHFGKLLDDKAHLKDGRFSIGDTPHVVHMTVKPQEVVDDEDARIAKGGARDREGNERSPGCRCIIL